MEGSFFLILVGIIYCPGTKKDHGWERIDNASVWFGRGRVRIFDESRNAFDGLCELEDILRLPVDSERVLQSALAGSDLN